MKSLHSKLAGVAPFIFFPLIIILRKKRNAVYAFALLIMISFSSCFLTFYRTNSKPSIDSATASKLRSEKKHFIIHFSNTEKGFEDAYVSNDSLFGKIVPIPPSQTRYLHPKSGSNKNAVRHKYKDSTLMQVHLYINTALSENDSVFAASVSSFYRVDVYELNKGATTANHIVSVVGIVAATLLAAAFIGFLIECNCPQLYMENNGVYSFTSGLYSGAVYSTLERTDYLPLNTVPFDAKDISFKIANGKNEEQFINKVELMQVNHSKDINVLTDRHGNIFTYQKTVEPSSALTGGQNDMKGILKQTDEHYYSFNNDANEDGFSDVRLTFDKPANADHAKLIIHARNTYWGGLMHKEFVSYFGDDFEKWRAKQEQADPKDLEKWQTDQALPLMVYVKTNNGWKFVDYYQLVGNTASRDMIMKVDTKNIPGNSIKIKLETAYRFWDLDFAGIDYSDDQNFTIAVIEPAQVLKSDSTDASGDLKTDDKQYAHLQNDQFISFRYSPPQPAANTVASYFLVSGGYYHSIEQVTGKVNYNELFKFKNHGYFDKFSREKYKEVQDIADVLNNKVDKR